MLIYKAFGRVQHLQNLTFSDKNAIKISYLFWYLILDVIFWDFGASWCQNSRFWDPLGAQLGTKWRPKSSKWRQKGCAAHPALALFRDPRTDLLQRSFLERSWVPFWWIWDGFCSNLDGILYHFQCISEVLAIRFVDCQRRLTRSELTATFEKMPRTAKNWQKPKANERRPPNYTLQHAVHETRSTEANASNNTGSAVLAPHGALGYHQNQFWSMQIRTSGHEAFENDVG